MRGMSRKTTFADTLPAPITVSGVICDEAVFRRRGCTALWCEG
jgi:hypothetical protein